MIQNTSRRNYIVKALVATLTALAFLVAIPVMADIKIRKPKTTEQKVQQQRQPQQGKRITKPTTKPRTRTRTYSGSSSSTVVEQTPVVTTQSRQDRTAEAERLYDLALSTDDDSRSFQYLKEAAEYGHAEAQALLGRCYYYGEGCRQDYSEAVKWYDMAEQRGSALAYNGIGLCYEKGYKKLTAGSTATPGQAAFMYYKKAADKGLSEGMANVGRCFLDSIGVTNISPLEAGRWLRKAALQGNEYALERIKGIEQGYQHSLERAVSYTQEAAQYEKEGRQKDAEDAMEFAYGFYKMAAIQGDDDSQAIIGMMSISGLGTTSDVEEGMEWLELAADQENTYALNFLGECYEEGKAGKRVDKDMAFLCYARAVGADYENEEATYNLGRCYQKGIGTDVDREMAIQLFQQSKASGNKDAEAQLKALGAN